MISLGCELKLEPGYGALQEVSEGGKLGIAGTGSCRCYSTGALTVSPSGTERSLKTFYLLENRSLDLLIEPSLSDGEGPL